MRPIRNLTRPRTSASLLRGSVSANARTSSIVTTAPRRSGYEPPIPRRPVVMPRSLAGRVAASRDRRRGHRAARFGRPRAGAERQRLPREDFVMNLVGCTNSIVPSKTPIQPPRLTSPLTGRITPKNSEVDRRRVLPTAPETCASVSGTECCFLTRETQSNSGRALAYTNSAFMESGTCGKIMFVHPRPPSQALRLDDLLQPLLRNLGARLAWPVWRQR